MIYTDLMKHTLTITIFVLALAFAAFAQGQAGMTTSVGTPAPGNPSYQLGLSGAPPSATCLLSRSVGVFTNLLGRADRSRHSTMFHHG